MTYARSRLLLGVSGVGILVLLSGALLYSGYPRDVLPTSEVWSWKDVMAFALIFFIAGIVMLPLDFLGGYVLPNHWRPDTISLRNFFKSWFRGVFTQAVFFLAASLVLLAAGRSYGLLGVIGAIGLVGLFLTSFQLYLARAVAGLSEDCTCDSKVEEACDLAVASSSTDRRRFPIRVLHNHDIGFTGGIVGLPGREEIVLSASAVRQVSSEQLGVVIARRIEAIVSGGRTRGVLLAFIWVATGFFLSASLPGAGVASVASLVMTGLGFTLWTFLGLLTLPTLSRQASYAIDSRIIRSGSNLGDMHEALQALDVVQDDEPSRSAFIETIFHPVPSVRNRESATSSENLEVARVPVAWHAARVTLYLSWACMGLLVRVVHCNVGRPELWVLLPTD